MSCTKTTISIYFNKLNYAFAHIAYMRVTLLHSWLFIF